MMAHTPIPWEIEYDNDDFGRWYSVGPAKIFFPYNCGQDEEEMAKAYAHLFAAAPDLLEACKAVYDSVDPNQPSTIPGRVMALVMTAIAKAEEGE